MSELSPVERKALKARAHHLDPVVMIGDAGLTPAVLREINVALGSHELIKVRVLGDDREARLEMYNTICTELNAAPVQNIGKLLILFRPKPEEEGSAPLKPRKPRGPRKTKKQLGGGLAVKSTRPATPRKAPQKTAARSAPKPFGRAPARPSTGRVTKSPLRPPARKSASKTPSRGTRRD